MVDQPLPPFFGRSKELAELHAWRASADHRTLVVSGRPGIGKSALLDASFGSHSEPPNNFAGLEHKPFEVLRVSCRQGARGQSPFDTVVAELIALAERHDLVVSDETRNGLAPFMQQNAVANSHRRRRASGAGRRRFDAHRLGERPHHRALVELLALVGRTVSIVLDGAEHLPVAACGTLRHVALSSVHHDVQVLVSGRDQLPAHIAGVLDELRSTGWVLDIVLDGIDDGDMSSLLCSHGLTIEESTDASTSLSSENAGNPRAALIAADVITDLLTEDLARTWSGLPEATKQLLTRLAVLRAPADCDELLADLYPVERVAAVEEATASGWLKRVAGRMYVAIVDDDASARVLAQLSATERDELSRWAIEFFGRVMPSDVRVLEHLRRVGTPDQFRARLLELGTAAADSEAWDDAASVLGEAATLGSPIPLDNLIDLAEARRRIGHDDAEETVGEAFEFAERAVDHRAMVRVALLRARPGDFTSLGAVDLTAVSRIERCLDFDDLTRDDEAMLLAALSAELLFDDDLSARQRIASRAWRLSTSSADHDVGFIGQLAIRNALVQPEQLDERIAAGRRLVELAKVSGNDWDLAHSYVLLSGNLLERGDRAGFVTRLDLADALNRTLGSPRLDYLISTRRSAGLIMDGRFIEAEAAIERDLHAAPSAGFGADYAFGLYGTQLSSIRGNQGRLGEMLEPIEYAVSQAPGFQPYAAMLAYVRAEGALGDPEQIAESLRSLAANGFSGLRRDYFWLSTMTLVARSATLVRAIDVCERCVDLLRPFSGRMAWSGTSNTGALDWYLGGLAGALGRLDEAEMLLSASAEQYQRCSMPVGMRHAQRHLAAVRSGRFDQAAAMIEPWTG